MIGVGLKIKNMQRHVVRFNIVLLVLHMGFLGMFLAIGADLMVYINIGSIVFYILNTFLCKKTTAVATFLMYYEIILHMACATVSLGWAFGFEFYFFALIPGTFFIAYIGNEANRNFGHPLVYSAISMALFVVAKFYTLNFEPIYDIQRESFKTALYIINSVASFSIIGASLLVFTKMINQTENSLLMDAKTDSLTELFNRRGIDQKLSECFSDCTEKHGQMALAVADVDGFKKFNDTYGHEMGDIILKSISDELLAISSNTCFAGRWGGDEFVVVTAEDNATSLLCERMSRVAGNIANKEFTHGNSTVKISVTIGIAEYNREYDMNTENLFSRADSYLYKGKESGKNTVIVEGKQYVG